MEGEDADVVQSPDQISVISAPTAAPKPEEQKVEEVQREEPQINIEIKNEELPTLGYCFSLYDYEGEADELTLEEGQVCIYLKASIKY